MQFYFIRHGQSTNNAMYAESVMAGTRVMDPDLTPLGERQAAHLAQFLRHGAPRAGVENPGAEAARPRNDESLGGDDWSNRTGFRLTHVYASLMVRAVRTGMAVAEALDLPLRAWVELHEAGGIYLNDEGGAPVGYPGNNRAYFTSNYPKLELPATVGEGGWWDRPYETDDERAQRAEGVLATLLERHGGTNDRVAVISHAGFYNSLLRVILGLPPRRQDQGSLRPWFMLHNTAITRIDFGLEETDLVYANRFDFLPPEDVT